jgi:S-adenosylmethionine-dependent methyltransferase
VREERTPGHADPSALVSHRLRRAVPLDDGPHAIRHVVERSVGTNDLRSGSRAKVAPPLHMMNAPLDSQPLTTNLFVRFQEDENVVVVPVYVGRLRQEGTFHEKHPRPAPPMLGCQSSESCRHRGMDDRIEVAACCLVLEDDSSERRTIDRPVRSPDSQPEALHEMPMNRRTGNIRLPSHGIEIDPRHARPGCESLRHCTLPASCGSSKTDDDHVENDGSPSRRGGQACPIRGECLRYGTDEGGRMSDVVREYYDGCAERESARLDGAYRRFELASTLRLIEEHFPTEGRILDIGGGPGRYTLELLRRGYRVVLVDLSPRCLDLAAQRLAKDNLQAEALLPLDARSLDGLPSESFDAALMLGPMYHIIDSQGRARALSELRRVLKPGAVAIVGFINPWGILRSGLAEFPEVFRNPDDAHGLLDTYIQAGEQKAFTEAAFLAPPQALSELRAAGFAVETRVGVEGFAAGMLDEVQRISNEDPTAYETILGLVVESCALPAYRDCTEHLHVVVRRLDDFSRE